jgi:hypothetical protein
VCACVRSEWRAHARGSNSFSREATAALGGRASERLCGWPAAGDALPTLRALLRCLAVTERKLTTTILCLVVGARHWTRFRPPRLCHYLQQQQPTASGSLARFPHTPTSSRGHTDTHPTHARYDILLLGSAERLELSPTSGSGDESGEQHPTAAATLWAHWMSSLNIVDHIRPPWCSRTIPCPRGGAALKLSTKYWSLQRSNATTIQRSRWHTEMVLVRSQHHTSNYVVNVASSIFRHKPANGYY